MAISRPCTVAALASSVSLAIAVGIGCQKPSPPVVQRQAATSSSAESTAEKPTPAPSAFEHAVDPKYPNGVLIKKYRGTEASVVIPDTIDGKSVVRVESDAFHCFDEKDTLQSVRLPASLMEIGNMSFKNRTGLKSIDFPDTLKSIGWNAFENCGLEKVRLPSSVTSVGAVCFFGCKNLSTVEVDAANDVYASVDGVLYDKNVTELIYCPLAKEGVLTLPATVTTIHDWSFANCKKLTHVRIPATTSTIGKQSFIGCDASREIIKEGAATTR